MKIKAKPCEWVEEDDKTWHDRKHGLSIIFELEDDEYHAEFNEYVGACFKTLKEAQDWCQKEMDDYINEHALLDESTESIH